MASYSKTTNFLAKDSLPSGNPSKKVKGSELDTEFNNVATADADSLKISTLGSGVQTFLVTPSSANLAAAVTGETGSGALVFATSPTLVTPALGTPASGTLTNCTGLPIAGIASLGTGVATALAVNVGTAGAFVVNGGALGSPSSAGTMPAFTLGGAITGNSQNISGLGTLGCGAITSSGILSTSDTTDATSTTAASLKTAGGLGVAKSIAVGTGIGVGGAAATRSGVQVSTSALVGAAQYGFESLFTGASDATAAIYGFQSNITTAAAAFTCTNLVNFNAADRAKGAGSTITNQTGFLASAMAQGTNIYGFRGQVAAAAGRYNLYMDGTAANYFGGVTTVADTTDSSSTSTGALVVSGGVGIAKKAYHGDNIVMASGKGIDFSATADGSGTVTSEVLSDYEEGTFTVTANSFTIVGTPTHTGTYTKVGRKVTVTIKSVSTTSIQASGSSNYTGLPYTASDVTCSSTSTNVSTTYSNGYITGVTLYPGTLAAQAQFYTVCTYFV